MCAAAGLGADIGVRTIKLGGPTKVEGRSESGPRHDVEERSESRDVLVSDILWLTDESVFASGFAGKNVRTLVRDAVDDEVVC